jgi:hypothetical protein
MSRTVETVNGFRLSPLRKDGDPGQQVVELLTGHGLPPAVARKLVECELTITPTTGIRPLTELLHGRPGEGGEWIESTIERKAAGAKVVAFLRWDGTSDPRPTALTELERELVIERGLNVEVREGFFGRAANYARSPDELIAVLKVFVPTAPCVRGERIASSRLDLLVAAVAKILRTSVD